jgi:hypothetical protein
MLIDVFSVYLRELKMFRILSYVVEGMMGNTAAPCILGPCRRKPEQGFGSYPVSAGMTIVGTNRKRIISPYAMTEAL